MIRGAFIKTTKKKLNTILLDEILQDDTKNIQSYHKFVDSEKYWKDSLGESKFFREEVLSEGYEILELYPCYHQGWECDEWGALGKKDGQVYRLETDHGTLHPVVYKPMVYLAGPDVFLPGAKEVFEAKKAICEKYGMNPLAPLDSELAFRTAEAIYEANIKFMNQADACLVNMDPFRGPGMDGGSAFEIGYMAAQHKPIVGYSNDLRLYHEKAREFRNYSLWQGITYTNNYSLVEDFGLSDNLMMEKALKSQPLASFEAAVKKLAELLGLGDN